MKRDIPLATKDIEPIRTQLLHVCLSRGAVPSKRDYLISEVKYVTIATLHSKNSRDSDQLDNKYISPRLCASMLSFVGLSGLNRKKGLQHLPLWI